MLALRSHVFNVLFYACLILWMVLAAPIYFILPRKIAYSVPKTWARFSHWLMKTVVGTTFEIEGLENIPDSGYILAPKHQSFWDTYALLPWLDDPVYILKRELMWIPFFGWYAAKQNMIPVNRGGRGKEMVKVMQRAAVEVRSGRQLVIYPEGTRRPPGADPEYKFGIARLYRDLNVPVVPVAMHAGLFWPRRSVMRYPGHYKIRILPPIQPGMKPDVFFEKLTSELETASDALLREAAQTNPDLPLPQIARQRLETLRAQEPAQNPS
ncbi:1-acyl-sn-glycerol-3-phosphate acyltransferase [Agrobacterium vitis]|uniref:1-acyl-sn-glycerol-3-phosphate acyltransferase n=1 Tax=Agrobacterium vitis TaxID=373 RepID=A0A368NRE3_AGRVI|nr:1-acyl-sn-glycerol-3-phosphate acyltransferase [Agrobacterium vitis]KAA3516935.1 1-acyl-sn-glycerol-3-phosphate acyltransferase [Agrobacterium vitis]KAA3529700.1 1-acyl-sn-glycerol-3-phosphate acyltransferase [Agrobacterium vitis]MCF1477277.1 1-acyl-sn-glycerol-3-phosphate acyltransferase [Agrobacterium vitis]MUZ97426.1 1-acyl-sn-glycerol-3-phosphate acyltransferase [Agrobacterium vitis]MVA28008.1 1-acyl-sn-glycerol-3-phosphate acyltransferase [Agrobacterium vitis]